MDLLLFADVEAALAAKENDKGRAFQHSNYYSPHNNLEQPAFHCQQISHYFQDNTSCNGSLSNFSVPYQSFGTCHIPDLDLQINTANVPGLYWYVNLFLVFFLYVVELRYSI